MTLQVLESWTGGGQIKNVTFLLFPRPVPVLHCKADQQLCYSPGHSSVEKNFPSCSYQSSSLSHTHSAVPSWSEVARNQSSSWRIWRRNISTISSWKTCPVSLRKWRTPLPDWTRKLANYLYLYLSKNIWSSETANVEAWPPTLASPWSSASPGRRVSPLRWRPFWSGVSAGPGSMTRSPSG